MNVTDLSGLGQAAAEARQLIIGLAELVCERSSRKQMNERWELENGRLRIENLAAFLELFQRFESVLKPRDFQERLMMLRELLTTVELSNQVVSTLLHNRTVSARRRQRKHPPAQATREDTCQEKLESPDMPGSSSTAYENRAPHHQIRDIRQFHR